MIQAEDVSYCSDLHLLGQQASGVPPHGVVAIDETRGEGEVGRMRRGTREEGADHG
jgi:hypothetical protein